MKFIARIGVIFQVIMKYSRIKISKFLTDE